MSGLFAGVLERQYTDLEERLVEANYLGLEGVWTGVLCQRRGLHGAIEGGLSKVASSLWIAFSTSRKLGARRRMTRSAGKRSAH